MFGWDLFIAHINLLVVCPVGWSDQTIGAFLNPTFSNDINSTTAEFSKS